jgi:hypothetical protein
MPPELRRLMERYNHLGSMLPHTDDERDDALEDIHTRASLRVLLREMAKVRSQIDAFLAAARTTH